jgi:hypothetical protein
LREGYVSNRIGIVGRIIIDNDMAARKRAKRQRLHKLTRPPGHRHSDRATGLLKSSEHFDSLVSSDTATDSKRNIRIDRRSLKIRRRHAA